MAIKKNLALFALFVFSTPAFAQGFGSPNGVGFPSTSSGSGGLTSPVGISDGGTGQTSKAAAFNALSPNTTGGDITYHNGTNNVRLAKGTALQQFRMNAAGTAPEWFSVAGVPFPFLSTSPLRKPMCFQSANAGTGDNAYTSFGVNNISLAGSGTVTKSSDNKYIKFASAASVNAIGGYFSGGNPLAKFAAPITMMTQVKTGANAADIANCRIWIGLASFSQATNATPANSVIMFGYDPAIDANQNWYVVTSNGTSTTRVDSGVPITYATEYTLGLEYSGSSVKFYVNGSLLATVSSNLPLSSDFVNYCCQITSINGVSKSIEWLSVWILV